MLKIKNKLKVKENQILLSNFFSLSALQMATYLFPLITFPYLVRILGIELFGVLAMATAVVTYFQIITDYGFDLTATKDISVHREDKEKIIEIFSSVMTIKFLLMIFSILLLSILIFSFEKFSQNYEVYYFTFGLVIGQVLFPIWFFQGMERMKYITILTVISKLIFTLSIFIFIQTKEDFMFVPLLYAISSIISGIISLYIIYKDFDIKFSWQTNKTIKRYFQEGWNIFMQRFYVNLYSTTNIVILGFLTNDMVVGFYSIAVRVVDIIRSFFKIISNVYYPYFAKKFIINPIQSLNNLKKVSIIMFFISVSVMLIVFIFDEFIISIIVGENYNFRITDTLQILSFGIMLLPFFSLFTTTLVATEQSKILNKIARDLAIISMVLAPPLIYLYEELGLAFLVVFLQFINIYRYVKTILTVHKGLIR